MTRVFSPSMAAWALAAFMLTAPSAFAAEIVIGAVYPLTGPLAQVGLDAKAAFGVASDIVNTKHDPIPGLLMGGGGGLPALGGDTIKIVYADSQNDPQKARAEAERLITQDHVVAIIGSFTSATAVTISQVTERYGIPYISAENSAPDLTEHGLKWFFRPSPTDATFTAAMFDFMKDMAAKTGHPVKSVSIFHEDSLFGTSSGKIQAADAKAAGLEVKADIAYRSSTPSLDAEAQRLKSADADALLPSSYTNDAILIMKAMHSIGYKPPVIIAQAAGFTEQSFITGVGPLADGIFSRSSFALDAAKGRPAIPAVEKLYEDANHKVLNDNTSREFTAFLVLADALNRAGSTDPAKLQAALVATDVPGNMTIMPWKGVKFDATGQNIEGTPVIQEIVDGKYMTVWPFDLATHQADWDLK